MIDSNDNDDDGNDDDDDDYRDLCYYRNDDSCFPLPTEDDRRRKIVPLALVQMVL